MSTPRMTLVMEGIPTVDDTNYIAVNLNCASWVVVDAEVAHRLPQGIRSDMRRDTFLSPCALFWFSADDKLYYVGKIVEAGE